MTGTLLRGVLLLGVSLLAWGASPSLARAKTMPKPVWKLEGHEKRVRLVTYSPDGEVVASADDQEIRLWSVANGKHLGTLVEERHSVEALLFSADGKQLIVTTARASSFDTKGVRCSLSWWDIQTRRKVRSLTFKGGLWPVALSPDRKILATAGGHPDKWALALRDPATGKVLREIALPNHLIVTFTPDSKHVLTCTYASKVTVWDVATGEEVRAFHVGGHHSATALAVSPDGKTLAVAYTDDINYYDLATGKLRLKGEDFWGSRNRHCLRFARGGDWLLTAVNTALVVLDPATGKRRLLALGSYRNAVEALDVSPDGKWLATGGDDCYVKIWKLSDW